MPPGEKTRILVELRRPALGVVAAARHLTPQAQRDYVASLNAEVGALLGALRAKGVTLGDVIEYARVWHGFAATVRTSAMPAVQALGLRVEPVRRFYGALATAGPTARGAAARAPRAARSRRSARPPGIALLDSGADPGARGLRGRIVPGPDLSGGGPGDRHGTVVAAVLARALPPSERILSIRIARREGDANGASPTESTTTDRLLAGLERAVDPNGDGDASDAVPVALVGVNSPFAGFEDAPEAKAVRAAAGLGTLVVAPAGNEGPGWGAFGTIGSPGASTGGLTVGATSTGRGTVPLVEVGAVSSGGRAVARGALLNGGLEATRVPAITLSGRSQANPRGGGADTGESPLQYLTVDARPRAAGRVVVVPFRDRGGAAPPLADRAAAAAQSRAAALVVCDPQGTEPFAPLPAGVSRSMPVIGVSGPDADGLLSVARGRAAVAFLSASTTDASSRPREGVARYSSRGPTYGLVAKPDLVADGTAAAGGSSGALTASGTSLSTARVAAAALVLHRRRPALRPAGIAAALVTSARPAGARLASGAGRVDLTAATRATLLPTAAALTFPVQRPTGPWVASRTVTIANTGRAPAVVSLVPEGGDGVRLSAFPGRFLMAARSTARVVVTAAAVAGPPAYATGGLGVQGPRSRVTLPIAIPVESPGRPSIGRLRLLRRGGSVSGVTFAAGSVQRRRGAIAVDPIRALTLVLLDPR
ncbi:MAG: S8 family serine peptidase, partial [Actinobacteria bacterium]|nr:S8 family serine peptidase [Actinomycetota bacterium]